MSGGRFNEAGSKGSGAPNKTERTEKAVFLAYLMMNDFVNFVRSAGLWTDVLLSSVSCFANSPRRYRPRQ